MSRIYLSPPDVRGNERELLEGALASNWIAPIGPDLDAFEQEIAATSGVNHAVGVSSGTAALHLALRELGVGPRDEVLISDFTFAAAANAAVYLGASPVFVDSDSDTWQLSVQLTSEVLDERAAKRTLPRAAVIVDLYGQCADYDQLMPLFESHGIPVVEDAAEALGATYRGRSAGSFGQCAVLSFNGNKIITTSGGGMFLSNHEALAERVRFLSTQAREPVVHYEHREVGFNYRLSNILAALGRAQLATLPERLQRRRGINDRYREALGSLPGISFMPVADYGNPNFWLTCVLIDPTAAGYTREHLRLNLEEADIESRPTWKPMHLQPVFKDAPARVDGTSEQIFNAGLCLPSGSGMTDQELETVISRILEYASSKN